MSYRLNNSQGFLLGFIFLIFITRL